MKEKVIAVLIMVILIGFVTANTVILRKQIDGIIKEVNTLIIDAPDATECAGELYDKFMHKEGYISLSVNHEDLTAIEEGFVEMIGYLKINNTEEAAVTKDRLTHSLEHLRRLSGFNIDAII